MKWKERKNFVCMMLKTGSFASIIYIQLSADGVIKIEKVFFILHV